MVFTTTLGAPRRHGTVRCTVSELKAIGTLEDFTAPGLVFLPSDTGVVEVSDGAHLFQCSGSFAEGNYKELR